MNIPSWAEYIGTTKVPGAVSHPLYLSESKYLIEGYLGGQVQENNHPIRMWSAAWDLKKIDWNLENI